MAIGDAPKNHPQQAADNFFGLAEDLPGLTAVGPISLPDRRRYRDALGGRALVCEHCRSMAPPVDAARAACAFAQVDAETIAYRHSEMTDEERDHYRTVTAQAWALVLAARSRGHASNNDLMDALGRAFSSLYGHVVAETPARSIREMTEVHAKAVRRELQLAGIDIAAIAAAPTKTPMYTITRTETIRANGTRRPGRRVVTIHERAAADFLAIMPCEYGAGWLPSATLEDAGESDVAAKETELGGWTPRHRILAEQKYEVVPSGERARRIIEFLQASRLVLDGQAFHDDLAVADARQTELAAELERRGIPPVRPRTKREEAARRVAIGHRAKALFPDDDKKARRKQRGWAQRALNTPERTRQVVAAARKNFPDGDQPDTDTKRARAIWRRETLSIVDEHDRVAGLLATYKPLSDQVPRAFTSVAPQYARTVNRRFQPTSSLWPPAVSNKVRPPWSESLRQRWFRAPDGERLLEMDVSSSQTQILACFLGEDDLERIAARDSFKKYLAERAWDGCRGGHGKFRLRDPLDARDAYRGSDDERLLALVKEAWMRTLYGSSAWQIAEDQSQHPDELGQGWDRANLQQFLSDVPGWKTVSKFLALCREVGAAAPYGIELTDPFDQEKFRWHPAARDSKPLSTRGSRSGFTFYIDVPRYALKNGEFRVDGRKIRDCVAPRLVHMLDAMFNALVVEQIAASDVDPHALTLVAVHDAWMISPRQAGKPDDHGPRADMPRRSPEEIAAIIAELEAMAKFENSTGKIPQDLLSDTPADIEYLRSGRWRIEWPAEPAAREWFKRLGPVYDDLIRLAPGRAWKKFAQNIKAKWQSRLVACREGRAGWPQFRLG